MKNIIYYLIIVSSFFIGSCSKWNEPTPLNVEDLNYDKYNNPAYKAYLEHLITYKNSNHSKLLGFVGNWDISNYNKSLGSIPDSVDMIALMNAPAVFNEAQTKDFGQVQTKGTKILYYLNALSISDSIMANPNYDPTKDSVTLSTYIDSISKIITANKYDGVILNMEGNVCYTCNTIFTSLSKTTYFFSLLGKLVGPAANNGKLFIVQGEPKDVGTANGIYFDYFIANTYNATSYNVPNARNVLFSSFSNYSTDKLIVTADFTDLDKAAAGGISFYTSSDGSYMPSSLALASWNPTNGKKGGLAIFYIENDAANNFYNYTRQAISIQNPPVK